MGRFINNVKKGRRRGKKGETGELIEKMDKGKPSRFQEGLGPCQNSRVE